MFLRRIPYQSVRRRRIRDWLLLLHAAGGARADRAGVRAAVLPQRDAGGRDAERRARAGRPARSPRTAWGTAIAGRKRRPPRAQRDRRARRRAIAPRSCSSPRAPKLAVRSDRRSRPARSRRSRRRAVGPGATRYAPALKLAGSLLGESALPRREVMLISDFQRRGWEADARPRRREAAGSDDADAGRRRRRDDREPVGHAGLAAAHALRESRSRHGHRRRRQSRRARRSRRARSTLEVDGQSPSSRCRPTSRPADRQRDVRAVHRRVAQHARRPSACRPTTSQRDNVFHFVAVAVRAGARARRHRTAGAERESLYLVARARRLASRRASS